MEEHEDKTESTDAEPVRSNGLLGGWRRVEDGLPPIGVPVWLYVPDLGQPMLGSREDGEDGWCWCRCYGEPWYDKGWHISDAEQDDDYHPSHWMPLPEPPQ